MINQCHLSYLEQGNPVPLEELSHKHGKTDSSDYRGYIDACIQGVLKVLVLLIALQKPFFLVLTMNNRAENNIL